jgi:enoyl-CoA hydratase/carnithine racemase
MGPAGGQRAHFETEAVMAERVRVHSAGDVAYLTLTRPDKHNGMDLPMLQAVLAAQKQLRKLRTARAIIVHGEGPSFCAGLDFKTLLAQPLKAASMYPQLLWPVRNQLQRWSMGFRALGVPVIAAIHGNCLGAGLQLALGADIRVATPDAKLSVLESKWGLVPDMGGPTLLRELVRVDVAKELTFTGRIVSGEQAHALGLVSHLDAEPLARAERLAEEIGTRSPDAVAAGKFLLQEAYADDTERVLGAERSWQRRLLGLRNQRVAIARNGAHADKPYYPRRIGV